MATMQIRDVPDEVHAELVRRAHVARQSLQQYMRSLLISEASRPNPADIFARAAKRARAASGAYGLEDATSDVRAMREDDRHA